jgi:DNA-binding CsgD family transcriptional regulator
MTAQHVAGQHTREETSQNDDREGTGETTAGREGAPRPVHTTDSAHLIRHTLSGIPVRGVELLETSSGQGIVRATAADCDTDTELLGWTLDLLEKDRHGGPVSNCPWQRAQHLQQHEQERHLLYVPILTRAYATGAIGCSFGALTPHDRNLATQAMCLVATLHTNITAVQNDMDRERGREGEEPAQLTERQHAILWHITHGRTNTQIARAIGYSESTVRQETMAIYRILHVKNRTQAAQIAREQGLVEQGSSAPEQTGRSLLHAS